MDLEVGCRLDAVCYFSSDSIWKADAGFSQLGKSITVCTVQEEKADFKLKPSKEDSREIQREDEIKRVDPRSFHPQKSLFRLDETSVLEISLGPVHHDKMCLSRFSEATTQRRK